MNKIIKIAILPFALMLLITTVYSAEEKVVINMSTNELAFSLNLLNTIDLAGEEVAPFLDIKNILTESYKKASAGKKASDDVDFTVPVAKNFLFFLQRVKLKGADAAIFYDLNKKIVDNIKKATKS